MAYVVIVVSRRKSDEVRIHPSIPSTSLVERMRCVGFVRSPNGSCVRLARRARRLDGIFVTWRQPA